MCLSFIRTSFYCHGSVIVLTCYSSPWTPLFSLVISKGVTDLLASYKFLVSGQKTTAISYIQFE
jgi:hypothetical protein